MREKLLLLLRRYGIPLPSLNKEVLIDEELLRESADFLGKDLLAPFAFPGFIFQFSRGIGLDIDERRCRAVREEYNIPCQVWSPPDFLLLKDSVFLEPDYRYAREVLLKTVLNQPERFVFVGRESVLLSVVAEPGWREYSPLSVLTQLLYDVEDIFRVENQAFFPPGKSSMGMAFFSLRERRDVERFYTFLRRAFERKRQKLRAGGRVWEKRPSEMEPQELWEAYETTKR